MKVAGTGPELRQVFIKTSKLDPTELKTSFRNLAGIMSKGQLVGFRPLTTLVRDERLLLGTSRRDAVDVAVWTPGEAAAPLIVHQSHKLVTFRKSHEY